MSPPTKPPATGGSYPLPFGQLAPLEFERLCLWLVKREGYSQAEHLGEAGSEGGRDVVAWKDGRRTVFQCKRVRAFTLSHARKEIEKLRRLPRGDQPHELGRNLRDGATEWSRVHRLLHRGGAGGRREWTVRRPLAGPAAGLGVPGWNVVRRAA